MKPVIRRRRFALLSFLALLGCAGGAAQSLDAATLMAAERSQGLKTALDRVIRANPLGQSSAILRNGFGALK